MINAVFGPYGYYEEMVLIARKAVIIDKMGYLGQTKCFGRTVIMENG